MEERYLNDESLPQELLAWISKFYTAKNKNESKSELFRIYEEIYWEAKDSWKFKEISYDKMRDVQNWFQELNDDE